MQTARRASNSPAADRPLRTTPAAAAVHVEDLQPSDLSSGIVARGLSKRFGDHWVLRDLELDVPPGTVLGLLGHNGAGKTTTVRILTTLSLPSRGSAAVAGRDVVRDPAGVRSLIGVAAQQSTVDGLLSARKNLELVGRLYHLPEVRAKRRADELLTRVGLADEANQLVKTFSGGMRRRLDLAASIMAQPPVLFLDEPTTGLDPRSRNDLWDLLRELVNEGTTLLLTTQYLEEADRLADNIVVLDHGQAIAQGSPATLKSQVGQDRVEVTVRDERHLDYAAAVTADLASGPASFDRARLTTTVPLRDGAGLVDIVRALDRAGIDTADLAVRQASLDDVFLTLTGPGRTAPAGKGNGDKPCAASVDISSTLRPRAPRLVRSPEIALPSKTRLRRFLSDSVDYAGRNVQHIRQIPEKLLDVTIQPVMFVLLFAYVFGGAIIVIGGNYKEFLVGGILVQSLTFGMMGPGMAIATDLQEGIVDRFRSLPASRLAYLVGHYIAEIAGLTISIFILLGSGLIIGWRPHTDTVSFVLAIVLLVFYASAMIWIGTGIGLAVRTPDSVQGVVFMIVFPLTFVSNAFVPIATMPALLQRFAEWNPVSAMVAAVRELFGNPGAPKVDGVWPLEHPVTASFIYCTIMVIAAIPFALNRYRARTTD